MMPRRRRSHREVRRSRLPRQPDMKTSSVALPVALAGLFSAAGCVHQMSAGRTEPGVAPGPGAPWPPPASVATTPAPAPAPSQIPPDLLKSAQDWGLNDLIDLALRNN